MLEKITSELCQQAREITGTETPNEQIIDEFMQLTKNERYDAIDDVFNLTQKHDVVSIVFQKEFSLIADKLGISPATLHCICMLDDRVSLDDTLKSSQRRSTGNGKPVEHDPLIEELEK